MTGHRSSLEETDSVSNGRNGAQIGSKKLVFGRTKYGSNVPKAAPMVTLLFTAIEAPAFLR